MDVITQRIIFAAAVNLGKFAIKLDEYLSSLKVHIEPMIKLRAKNKILCRL